MKRWWIAAAIVGSLALLAVIGYAGYATSRPADETPVVKPSTVSVERCDVEQSASAPGNAVLTREEVVQMPAEGRLAEIRVYEGQKVSRGQVLARLDDAEVYQEQLASAELALIQAQRTMQEILEQAPVKTAQAYATLLEAQKNLQQAQTRRLSKSYGRASPETIDIARANAMMAKIALDEAEENWRVNSGRDDDDPEKAAALSRAAAARQEYNRAKANLDWLLNGPSELDISLADNAITLAQAQLAAAEEAWARVKEGPDALLVKQGEAEAARAAADRKQAEEVLAQVEVRAPFDGIITEVSARAGETLAAHTPIFTMIDPSALEVEATVTEEDLPSLKEGMAVNLFFDALPDETVTGKVKSIIPRRLAGDSPRYLLRVSLEAQPDGLADGMSADASIVLDRRANVLCLPRGVVRASAEGKAIVQVWNGLGTEKREITVGLRGDSNVEILSGVVEGEEVVAK